MLLFLMFACIDTSMRLFPRKKSVATMFASFHHSSWNLYVRFLFTESAICRSPPDKLKIMSSGYGVNSAIAAHNGFWLFRDLFGAMIIFSRYLNSPSTVCWLPQAWGSVGHSQSYSRIKLIYKYDSRNKIEMILKIRTSTVHIIFLKSSSSIFK